MKWNHDEISEIDRTFGGEQRLNEQSLLDRMSKRNILTTHFIPGSCMSKQALFILSKFI